LTALLLALAGWLDAIGLGGWMRGSTLAYPVVNILHLVGLVLLVGGIGVLDLRLAGLWRRVPLGPLAAALQPLAAAGLAVMIASGAMLFAADGRALAASPLFQAKLGLILLAIGNALAFRWRYRRRLAANVVRMPPGGRLLAFTSLALWLAILVCGRLIAYR
jgi:hypothetical protein